MKTITLMALTLLINQAAFGAKPIDTYPDQANHRYMERIDARQGTIGNIQQLNNLITKNTSQDQLDQIIAEQKNLIKGGHIRDLSDKQSILSCLQSSNEGQIVTAVLMLQEKPNLITMTIRRQLQEISTIVHPRISDEIQKILSFGFEANCSQK